MNKKMLWILVTIIGVSVVANVFLVGTNLQVQNQFTDLRTTYEALVVERDALKAKVVTLVTERDALLTQVTALSSERDALKNERNSLNGEVSSLTTERDDLKDQMSTLVTERDDALALTDEYEGLKYALIAEVNALTTERNDLKTQVYTLTVARDAALGDIYDLQAEIQQLRVGRLMSDLGSYDNRDNSLQPYIHVYGIIWNVGTYPASNCKLPVTAKQGDVEAVDTYINVGTLSGYETNPHTSLKEIDQRVYYTGTALTDRQIVLEYD